MLRWKYWGNELRRPELSPLAPEFLLVVPRSDLWVAEDWEMPAVELLRQNEARLDKPAILHSKQLRTFFACNFANARRFKKFFHQEI